MAEKPELSVGQYVDRCVCLLPNVDDLSPVYILIHLLEMLSSDMLVGNAF